MNCRNCDATFEELNAVASYCQSEQLPLPALCHECRIQTLYGYRNLRALYRRNCNKCKKSIITMFSPEAPRQVFCHDCWWSDTWDPLSFGQDFDFSKSLAEQLDALLHKVPLSPLISGNSENSDYVNFAYGNKDSYLISASDYNENCYYSSHLFKCRDVVDCLFCIESELLYDSLDCSHCYSSSLLKECQTCRDSMFLLECRNCSHCLGCVALDRGEYMVLNKKVSEADYQTTLQRICNNKDAWNDFRERFLELCDATPGPASHLLNCHQSTGDHLVQSKNAVHCFDSLNLEDCSYLITSLDAKDCHCSIGVGKSELCYQVAGCPENYGLKFSCYTWPTSSNLEYCFFCRSSSNSFGCVALKKNEFCILNKQYSASDYENMIKKVREHLTKTGEYGNFLPIRFSYFAYNETEAQERFPFSKEDALLSELSWKDGVWEMPDNLPAWPYNQIEKIEITAQTLDCIGCARAFKLILPELSFYEKCRVNPPSYCHDCRHAIRTSKRSPRMLRTVNCHKCGIITSTSEHKTSRRPLFCAVCYNTWREGHH